MRTSGRIVITVGLLLLGLGAVDVAPAAAGGGGCHRDMQSGPVEAGGAAVELVQACMTPSVLRIDPGTVVTFVNQDGFSHNLYGSGMYVHDLAAQGRVAFRFDDVGTFPYACTLHPGMVGAIAVGDGRRTQPASTSILPVEVEPAAAPSPPATVAPMPLSATSPATDMDEDAVPVVPAAITVTTIAALAYVTGRRGRRRISAS